MDLMVAILLCLMFLALIILGEIYLEMDKQRACAIECLKKMSENLDKWVDRTVELAGFSDSGQKTAEELRALAQSYIGCKKNKKTLMAVSLVNSMVTLSVPLEDMASGPEASTILQARAVAADSLNFLRDEYNKCARKLNRRLGKKIPAAVGRLFRIGRMEELRQLSDA